MRDVHREMLRFAAVGVLGLLVDVLVLYLCLALGLGPFAGRALSFLAAVWVTFCCNRHFTFGAGAAAGLAWPAWWRYLAAMLVGGLLNLAVYSALMVALPAMALLPLVAVAAGSLAGMTLNFASAKLLVFQRRP